MSKYANFEPPKVNGLYQTHTGYNYSFLIFDEKLFFNYDYIEEKKAMMNDNRYLGLKIAFVYLIAIFALQMYMRERERFRLKKLLIVWNLGLSIFSILGASRLAPEFFYTLYTKGFTYSCCNNDYVYGPPGLWWYLFFLSKIPELFDTAFIILRKRKLIFLHYYHHATVVISCWLWFAEVPSAGRWFGFMNYFVHAFMYTYYTARSLDIQLPRPLAKVITSLQIFQMFMAVFVTFYIYFMKKYYYETVGKTCMTTDPNLKYSFTMYFTYLILFCHFFGQAYIFKNNSKGKNNKVEKNKSESSSSTSSASSDMRKAKIC